MKPLVIYHDNCADGFGAAFAAWLKLGDEAEYMPMQYGKLPLDWANTCMGREVYILDFSFPLETMHYVFAHAERVVWLDHHHGVFKDYGLDPAKRHEERADNDLPESGFLPHHKSHVTILDNSKSGALLAWEYFHPGTEVPMFIKHIDDYDRWQFKLDGTKAFNKALWSDAPWSFEQWKGYWASGEPEHNLNVARAISEGSAILRAHDQNVQAVVKGAGRGCQIYVGTIDDWSPDFTGAVFTGLAANCPPHLTSDVGHELANQSGTFGLCWYINKDGRCFCSMRSNGDYDVSAIAKALGGGGHKNAAGFETDINTLLGWIK